MKKINIKISLNKINRVALKLLSLILFIILLSSAAVLEFEKVHGGGNILNIHDALWWSLSTITSLGYGDFFPVSMGGRAVAVFLMFFGITVFLTFASVITASILSAQEEIEIKKENEALHKINILEKELVKNRELLEELLKGVEKSKVLK